MLLVGQKDVFVVGWSSTFGGEVESLSDLEDMVFELCII